MNNTQRAIHIVKTCIKQHDSFMPLMLIGFNKEDESIALLGSFSNPQEQEIFYTLSRLAFILYRIKEYHVLTHGLFKDGIHDLNSTTVKKEKLLNIFLTGRKKDKSIDNLEIILDTQITYANRICFVYKVARTGHTIRISKNISFDAEAQGIFSDLLPTKEVKLPVNIAMNIKRMVNRVRYIVPDS